MQELQQERVNYAEPLWAAVVTHSNIKPCNRKVIFYVYCYQGKHCTGLHTFLEKIFVENFKPVKGILSLKHSNSILV